MKNTMILTGLLIIIVVIFAGCIGTTNRNDDDIENESNNKYPIHEKITVTLFWIGEDGNEENGYIPNIQSAWDDEWLTHYGDVDDPLNRNDYYPANFTPSENPFYFALPYNDLNENGERKAESSDHIYWSHEKEWSEFESKCKNRWIKIIKGDKIAYAQWGDVGPFGEDDTAYVFGDALPINEINNNAGLDVSPAVRDFLNLNDIDIVDWQFVDFNEVPDGPWKEIITNSQIYWK